MKEKFKSPIFISLILFVLFVLWTVTVKFVDVRPIGPHGSSVGLSTFNEWCYSLFGTNFDLYILTDWLGLVPIAIMLGFAVLGLVEWIKRKNILKVDYTILVLGGFYILVATVYIFFEAAVVNYRPVLINGYLEASYPSSTTMLVLTVMPSEMIEIHRRAKKKCVKSLVLFASLFFTLFMVVGRLVSGVHWITDIVGGALISASLVTLYAGVCGLEKNIKERE